MTLSLVIAILVSMLGSGIVFASDSAKPGDVLYNIDQNIEAMRLNLADPDELAYLQLGFASERLQEAEQLSIEGDQTNLKIALEHYNEIILNVAEEIGEVEGADYADLSDLLDWTFTNHVEQLARIMANLDKGEQVVVEKEPAEVPDDDEKADSNYCVGDDQHPRGLALAATYEDEFAGEDGYVLIMGWFCDGNFGFGQIKHALETSAKVDVLPTGETDFVEKAEKLLEMRSTLGWGKIWQKLELIGSDDDDDDPDSDGQDYCVGADPHPVAEDLADTYGVDYGKIMTWFCNGNFGFGEIKHALETSAKVDVLPNGETDFLEKVEKLLEMRSTMGWGKIWKDLDLIGKPEGAGKPDNVGPNNDTGKPDKADKSKGKP